MSRPVRARRLTTDEGQHLLRLVRRGRHDSVRYRRALIIMASASGTGVPAIARLVAAHPDTVRDVIHAFNARGLAVLPPHWAHGRPRRITDEDINVIVATATTRPKKARFAVHTLEHPQAHRVRERPLRPSRAGPGTGPGGAHRPGTRAGDPAPARHQLSTHPDLEDVGRPGLA